MALHREYTVGARLGTGSCGIVRKAIRDDGQVFAIKSIVVESEEDRNFVAREVRIMRKLNHKHIVRFNEAVVTNNLTHLVMELATGGNLLEYVNSHNPLSEGRVRLLFSQIVDAVRYAHQSNFVHRDLKLENILLDNGGGVKIADWGFACKWKAGAKITEKVGSLHYCAPEVLLEKAYRGPEIDCWSLGVILYALSASTLPFTQLPGEEDKLPLTNRIIRGEYSFPGTISPECAGLISGLLDVNRRRRFGLDDVVKHSWMMGNQQRHVSSILTTPRRHSRSITHSNKLAYTNVI